VANSDNKYKFRAVKVFESAEWMHNSTKKYRTVFDKNELSYVWGELSFYNKLFDEKDWNAKLTLKASEIVNNRRVTVSEQTENLDIKKDENIIYWHKGWGNDKVGSFWQRGQYVWEAFINDVPVGEQIFYIEDVGMVTDTSNPYFFIESIKLFTGPSDGWKTENRKYLTQISRLNTQYVWVEIKLHNKLDISYNLEFFINFYDGAHQHKSQIQVYRLIDLASKDMIYTFDRGWGNDTPGSWIDENYTAEIVFMDNLVAVVPFTVGDADIEGETKFYSSSNLPIIANSNVNTGFQSNAATSEADYTLEDLMKQLNELIGLAKIKKAIENHIHYIDFLKLRREKGFDESESIVLHSVFTGNPGTGKTTVVKMLGKIYNKIGLLSKGHVHEVDRADLVGEYIGQTAPRTKKAIGDARGGILFIDEAYSLARSDDDSKDFGREVIEVLLKELADGPGDIAIMVAGYPEEMTNFMESNPGLKSRFKHHFHFDDYVPEELMQIAEFAAEKRGVKLSFDAHKYIAEMLMDAYRDRNKSFGNARLAHAIVDEAKMHMGLRVIHEPDIKSLPQSKLSTIEAEDVLKIMIKSDKRKIDIPIDENLLRDALTELSRLTGLGNIKADINEMVKLVRYYRETGKDVLNKFSLHTVFRGNPGTGKTTVTRIIGKIYKALGLLERGHIVETDREGLIAGFVGQTALKTMEKINKAMGGILFIDEAYALAEDGQNSFGREAIEVVLKNMEDHRGDFAVIIAGYPAPMDKLLRMNPGLKSRFDRALTFVDYTPEELFEIATQMLKREGLKTDDMAAAHIRQYLFNLHLSRDQYFGNAREVRKMIERSIINQNLRMASLSKEHRTADAVETLTYEDVKDFVAGNAPNSNRQRIGF